MNIKAIPTLQMDVTKFKIQVKSLWNEGNILLTKKNEENDLDILRKKTLDWINSLDLFFKKSFSIENNHFKNIVSSGVRDKINFHNINGYSIDQIKKTIDQKLINIDYVEHLILMSDAVIDPYVIEKENRKQFTFSDKKALLIEKLYQSYDSEFYFNLEDLFLGNGLMMRRDSDLNEFAKILANEGFIEIKEYGALQVRLTTAGAMKMEEKFSSNQRELNIEDEKQKAFDEILSEIKDELEKANSGNEILFEELQEIKEAIGKVPKKNLFEMVKGKVIDLAIKEVISRETAVYVYEKFTGSKFNLPSLIQSTVNAINNAVDWTKP